MANSELSQLEFVKQWFENRPGRDIPNSESKPAIELEWLTLTGRRLEDSDRAIRTLRKKGILRRVQQGIYRFDPENIENAKGPEFSEIAENAVFARDGFKCKVCNQAAGHGLRLHVAFVIEPRDGGKTIASNGKTLCSKHLLIDQLTKNLLPATALAGKLQRFAEQLGEKDSESESLFWNALLDVVAEYSPIGVEEWDKMYLKY